MTEIAAMAAYLPPDSACALAVNKHPHRTLAELLREIEHDLRLLGWSGGARPEPITLPWDEARFGSGDAVEWDDAAGTWTDPRFTDMLARLEAQM